MKSNNSLLKSLLLFFLVAFSAFGQNKATLFLNKAAAHFKAQKNCSIQFTYHIQNLKTNQDVENEGNLLMEGNKYVLNFMGITKLFDGKKIYAINAEDEEVVISTPKRNKLDLVNPQQLFAQFSNSFIPNWDIQQKLGKQVIQYIKLTPKDPTDERKEVLLGINAKTYQLYTVIEVNRKGGRNTLTIKTWKNNLNLPKNQFTFVSNQYKGYYINQLDRP
ncbi:MAG: hypothetical protein CFE24_03555 [Flavobacterium sp. BFFFF2]|nr:MAG: hypothetical protein CFE24_03555 [Flavobacterium sp. BFFFF2]